MTSENGFTYQYDSIGNRISKNNEIHTYNSQNQLLKNTSEYSHEKNGNLFEIDSRIIYYYDALDRLIKVIDKNGLTTTYQYDGFDRRVSKSCEGTITQYLYQENNDIGAILNGKISELRILGVGKGAEIGAAVALELNGESYVPLHDPYGNVVSLLDFSGNVVEQYRFTAFGEEQINSEINNPWRFSSKRADPETGLIYFGKRYYASDIGRWITQDPLGYADGNNLYAFVHNHPLSYVDPDGQFAFLALLPVAMVMVEPFLPAMSAYWGQYALGTAVAGCLTGFVEGYNDPTKIVSNFGALMMGDISATGPLAAGLLGFAVSLNPTSKATSYGTKMAQQVGLSHLGSMASTIATKQASCAVGRAAVNSTEKSIAKVPALWQKSIRPDKWTYQVTRQETFSLDALSKAGQVMDRAGLTRAGRALEKHGGRLGGSFPKPVGSVRNKNLLGQFVLDDILTDPCTVIFRDKFGNMKYYSPNGKGAHFRQNGLFKGFIEGQYE